MIILLNVLNKKNKKDLFSLDFFGNFSLSSTFDVLYIEKKNKKKNNTLHSIFGKCEIKKRMNKIIFVSLS